MKFEDAIKHSVNYLKSKEFTEREDTATTLPTINKLIELNKAGCITYDSQAGITNKYNTERAYIAGFMLREHAEKLMQCIMMNTDIIFFIVASCDDADWMNNPIYNKAARIPLTLATQSKKVETTMTTIMPLSIIDSERKQLKINKTRDLVPIFCFDSKWGRHTLSKYGLLNQLLHCLHNRK
jgi:hypothetical protein